MQISVLYWSDVIISSDKKVIKLSQATIEIGKDVISIVEKVHDCPRTFAYCKPKVVYLTPIGCEFTAEGWGSECHYDSKGKLTHTTELPRYKVTIKAKF